MNLPLRILSTVSLLLAASRSLPAQQPDTSAPHQSPPAPTRPRPKIGVALEGGGALGLAHIGVLKWFEEHHIPVDYIAGTSMGGLVGGLYATGKNPRQLEEIVSQQQWDIII